MKPEHNHDISEHFKAREAQDAATREARRRTERIVAAIRKRATAPVDEDARTTSYSVTEGADYADGPRIGTVYVSVSFCDGAETVTAGMNLTGDTADELILLLTGVAPG